MDVFMVFIKQQTYGNDWESLLAAGCMKSPQGFRWGILVEMIVRESQKSPLFFKFFIISP